MQEWSGREAASGEPEVAFLATDIESSTSLWETNPGAMRSALDRHDAILHRTIADHGGRVVKTLGDGFYAVFAKPGAALAAARAAQRALAAEPWPPATPIRVRMALHMGPAHARAGDYFGPTVNRVARLLAAAHGGQTLLTEAMTARCRLLPAGMSLVDLGKHRLKDLSRPEHVYELRHEGAPAPFPPIRSLSTHPHNLPVQTTSLIGRDGDLASLRALLRERRLVTLVGPGGCGKSRLALQAAADALPNHADGVWLVELAPLPEGAACEDAVLATLGLRESAAGSKLEPIREHLRARALLLVLDNCEHVLSSAAEIARTVLGACADVRVIATSRAPLDVHGEQIFQVPCLALPRDATPDAARRSDAVALFADRARLRDAAFGLGEGTVDAIATICRKLDGLPLAIELAAAQAGTYAVDEIARLLDRSLALVTQAPRPNAARQKTLEASFEWSHGLLASDEQRVLQRLALFAGGCRIDSVDGPDAMAGMPAAAAGIVAALCAKSLVVRDERDGFSRFRLLETTRTFAQDKLAASGDGPAARAAFAAHFDAMATRAAQAWGTPAQASWLARLAEEHDNLRACLAWCAEVGETSRGASICRGLMRFWILRGHFSEGRRLAAAILARMGGEATADRASTAHVAGSLAYYQSDFAAARAAFEEALRLREVLGDDAGALATSNNLGNVAIEQGDYAVARRMHARCLALAREREDRPSVANALLNLGVVAEKDRDLVRAQELYAEALALRQGLGDRWGMAAALNNLGNVAFERGDLDRSRALHEDGLALRREVGDRRGEALALGNLAGIAFEQGSPGGAHAMHLAALRLATDVGESRQVAHAFDGIADAEASLGRPLRAAFLWGAAEALTTSIGSASTRPARGDVQARVAAARAACDARAFDAAWREGARASVADATAFAQGDARQRTARTADGENPPGP